MKKVESTNLSAGHPSGLGLFASFISWTNDAKRPSPIWAAGAITVCALLFVQCAAAKELTVGPDKTYGTIGEAVGKAVAGDAIVVYPREGNRPYKGEALLVRTPRLTIKAAPAKAVQRVVISGEGFNYSGAGKIPRAIFQFDPQASGCVLEGFELKDARNDSNNGAGVRINQANDVTVRNCEIHNCDMGVMSNGNGTPKTAVNQRFEGCLIHDNGARHEEGQSHNLYLGGTSVTLSACEVYGSTTGHNVKSRAHLTWVEYSYIHDSANREFDLVDAKGDTTAADSDAVLLGNIIVKDPKCTGNKAVIHFGQDGGKGHNGTLHLVHNTIVTPFTMPVVDMSASDGKAKLINNIIWDGGSGRQNQTLVKLAKGAGAGSVSVSCNWLSAGQAAPAGVSLDKTFTARAGQSPPFVDAAKRQFQLSKPDPSIADAGVPWARIMLPAEPGAAKYSAGELQQYKAPLEKQRRPHFDARARADLGALTVDQAK